MKKDIKPFLFFSIIASLLVGHLANRTALIFEGLTGNLVENINAAIDAIIPALQNNPFMIGTSKTALISGAIGAACVWLIFLYNVFGAKNFMRGSEHGSARWGTAKDIKPLTDREPDMNIPLSATEQISVRKVKDFEADRNKNIVVVGGSGSGKTYSEIKPSLMQLHSSYVITDPKGTILPETGYLFTNNGYTVRSFNTIDFSKSLHYNPLAYIHKEKDILKVVTVLMENTNGEGTGSGEKFWKDCEKLLPTETAYTFIDLVTDKIKEPELTAEWEKQLAAIQRGEKNPTDFMQEISGFIRSFVMDTKALYSPEQSTGVFQSERESIGICPKCGKKVVEYPKSFSCESGKGGCGFVIWKTTASKAISKAQAVKLLAKGKTDLIKGFTSKAGKPFDANLVLKEDKTVGFDFPPRK